MDVEKLVAELRSDLHAGRVPRQHQAADALEALTKELAEAREDIDWRQTARVFCERLGIEAKADAMHICEAIARLQRELEDVKAERDRANTSAGAWEKVAGINKGHAEAAESRLSEMEKELERLEAWKAEATELLDEFCAVSGVWLDPRNDDVHRRARRLVEGDGNG